MGQKIGAQPKADDRHIPLIHQRAQLVDLLWCEELALIGNDDIHAGVLIEFFDDIILRQDDIRLFAKPMRDLMISAPSRVSTEGLMSQTVMPSSS